MVNLLKRVIFDLYPLSGTYGIRHHSHSGGSDGNHINAALQYSLEGDLVLALSQGRPHCFIQTRYTSFDSPCAMSNETLLPDGSEWLLRMNYTSREVHGVTVS
jgi:hypothetical protein